MYFPPRHLGAFAESASARRGARKGAWQLQTAAAMLRLAESGRQERTRLDASQPHRIRRRCSELGAKISEGGLLRQGRHTDL